MAEEDTEDKDEEGEGEGQVEAKQGKGKLIVIIGAALLIVVGGAGAAYFTGLLDPLVEMMSGSAETNAEGGGPKSAGQQNTVFFDLPELLVNMNTGGRKSTFLKIRVSLELASADDIPKIEAAMPRIIDNFQTYLRELRVEDLKGSAGMYRLREALLTRVSAAVAPAQIKDLLFKEILLQ